MSESIAGIPPPRFGPMPPPTMTSLEIVGESLFALRQSFSQHWGLWLAAIVFFTGTNIADIVFASPGNPLHSPLAIGSLVVRVLAYIWVAAAAVRAFAGRDAIWAINLPLLRCAAALALLTVLSLVLLLIVSHFITNPIIGLVMSNPHIGHTASLFVIAFWLLGFAIATIRLSPWIAALAIGDRSIGLMAAWKVMRGATLAAIGALVWTAPVPMAHLVLTSQAQYLTGTPQLILTVIDGLVSVLQVLLAMSIAAVLYRFVANNPPGK